MKKMGLLAAGCLALCLTGCGKQEQTYAESCWESISYVTKAEEYAAETAWSLDVEALKDEAGDEEGPLSRQFMATALLCAAEHGKQTEEYPVSAPYADAFLPKVLTEEEDFWKALDEVSYFETFLPLLLNASKELDGELLVKLLMEIPEDSGFKYGLRQELDGWIRENPETMIIYGDELTAAGYFDSWSGSNWRTNLFGESLRADSVDEALRYVAYLRGKVLPMVQTERDPALFTVTSKLTGEDYLQTTMTIGIEQELILQEPGDGNLPEEIVTEGKKPIALYRNPHGDEFPGSPEPLRLIGDFMLNLPDRECPASIDDADYYLVLTPAYEYGGFYVNDDGEASDIRIVFSTTSVDLYEAGTGRFLRHLGNVIEEPERGIVARGTDHGLRYPEEVEADILYYIYSHVNDPDSYAALVDQVGEQVKFERDETIQVGQWEMAYHAYEAADAFETRLSRYTAAKGNQLIRAEFTVTNRGNKKALLFSMSADRWEDVSIFLFDYANDVTYDCINQGSASTDLGLLGKGTLEPGESLTGDIVFEVKEEALRKKDYLFIVVTKGKQILICPLGE